MKKLKALVPLITALAVLASCDGTSSSVEPSSGTSSETPVESTVIDGSSDTGESTGGESTGGEESSGGESSEEPSSTTPSAELTQDQIDALASGYAIDISVDGTAYGSLALNATGATVGCADYGTYYYIPEVVTDEEGNSETYVAQATLNLANEVETEVYDTTWASMWTNVWSLLSVNDFTKLNAGVYQLYLDDLDNATAVENYAITQLGLQMISDVSDITVTTDGESITSIDVATSGGEVITDTVTAVGDAVETGVAPATGDSISAIDEMMTALDAMDYMMTEEYAFLDEESGEYVVDSSYSYSVYVDGGVYAYDGDGYIQLTTGVEYCVVSSGYWYVGTIFYGYTLAEMLYLIDDWQISSVLFEETDTEGTYALRDDVPVTADMGYYDAYMEGYTANDLTITVGEDSIVFTAMLDSETQYIVSYTGVGSTDISSTLGSNSSVYIRTLRSYYSSIVSYAGSLSLATGLGTSDQNLWYEAFSHVYLPLYGLGSVSFTRLEYDPFLSSSYTGSEYNVTILYDVTGAYYYFELYLYMHGFSYTSVTVDGYSYDVYTYTFNYTYYTDSEGNVVDSDTDGATSVTESHTVSVYMNGYYTSTTSTSSGYAYMYNVSIDLDLSSYTSAD